MKTAVILSIAAFCVAFTCSAHADDAKKAEALAKSNGCMACHAIDTKLVGPSYKDVAAKYHHVMGAEAILMKKVKDGSSGVWGPIPMPPHPGISDADLKIMVDWVLSSE
jgi:cytochrome c